ncbi:MAG: GNAT family N-acetyltransferase [Candidatus Latescibacteria bacterium]|nr:GNAT family N-acetyltransferase [Candidatus Latescibacterota bacterium]
MPHPTRNLVVDWRPDDSVKLARLQKESAVAWPGGDDWQISPQEIERWIREGDHIGAFVTEDGDRIISLCTLIAKPGQHVHTYIPHLNCHPQYHGKKHGKAVLRAAVEYVHQAGYRKVDLGTWPGNMKAVPLYKKTGFMWEPDTSVHMENFTPAARQHPLAADFFARHDWYDTLERSLALEEDLMERGPVKVYEYLWQAADGMYLRLVFDRQSWGLIEVETEKLAAACRLPGEWLVAGKPHAWGWQFTNKGGQPVQLAFDLSGDPGVEAYHRQVLEVGQEAELDGSFTIDPDIAAKKIDPKAQTLTTRALVDGVEVELQAGIEVRQALDLSLVSTSAVLVPGRKQNALISVRSHLDESCRARIEVLPGANASVGRRVLQVDLGPRQGAEIAVAVTALQEGPVGLDVQAQAQVGRQRIAVKRKKLELLALAPGTVGGVIGQDQVLLASTALLVRADLRHGGIEFFHRLRGASARRLQWYRPQVGPPFSWDDLFQDRAVATLSQGPEGTTLCIQAPSKLQPGLILERHLTLGQGPLVKAVDTLVNGTARRLDLAVSQEFRHDLGLKGEMVVPRPEGIYGDRAQAGGRDLGELKLPVEGADWPQGWISFQRPDGCAVGFMWERAVRVAAGNWSEVRLGTQKVPAGQSRALPAYYAFVGDGNWQTVQAWWQSLLGDGPPQEEEPAPAPRRPLELGLEPEPLLIGQSVKGRLRLSNPGTYKLQGKIEVAPGPGLQVQPAVIEVEDLCRDKPVKRPLQISRRARAQTGPSEITLRFANAEAVYSSKHPAFILPAKSAPVRIERGQKGDLVQLDNGLLSLDVAPSFCGGIVALERQGRSFLTSSYPEAGIYHWMNPWYGGVHPKYYPLEDHLHRETFRCRTIRRKGRQGLVWQGVRLSCTIAQEQARGQVIEYDYLVTPGVPIVAVVVRCLDKVGVRGRGDLGFEVWPSFADKPGTATFYRPDVEDRSILAAPHWHSAGSWSWGGLIGNKGESLLLSASGQGTSGQGMSTGPAGSLLTARLSGALAANGRIEGLFFLVPALDPEEAKSYQIWSQFDELP